MNQIAEEISNELEKTQHDFWNISHQTAEFISMLIKSAHVKNVLEIGTSNGYSTLWIADALKDAGDNGHLTTIEYYEKRQCIARANIAANFAHRHNTVCHNHLVQFCHIAG